jgi:hypothetical protein
MKKFILVSGLMFLTLCFSCFASAGVPLPSCERIYNNCITSCCEQCGSYTTYNSQGDLVCSLGSADNPNQRCIDACLPCSEQYHSCVNNQGGSEDDLASGNASCSCCGALLMPLASALGAVLLKT